MSQNRLDFLFEELRLSFPDNKYLTRLDTDLINLEDCKAIYSIYANAIECLDDKSWKILKEKAACAFPAHHLQRGKQNFFNQLNESFAYEFLLVSGFSKIELIEENKKSKTPDISYENAGNQYACEVKTIGISLEEIQRFASGNVFDSGIYLKLSDGFFNKLHDTITKAIIQINSFRKNGIVFLIMEFDDFTLQNYSTYELEISNFLSVNFPNFEIYMKVGIQSKKYLHHKPSMIIKN